MIQAKTRTLKGLLLSCLAAVLLALSMGGCSYYESFELGEPQDAGDADTTWTVLVYMCGSDLESQGGLATDNLVELTGSQLSDNVKFVIQTGGASNWRNNVITAKKIERYEAEPSGIAFIEDKPLASMGEASTLSDFISWGTKKYPADRTMLIFWDHGGGSLAGVCADELFTRKGEIDTLTLPEMARALKKANHHFDIIGFDTCLMATLETAQAVEPWGDYLIASEETEPGGGWAYDTWPAWLAEYPGVAPDELSRAICDSYFYKCVSTHTDDMSTLSVTDLSKVPALAKAFELASNEIFLSTADVNRLRVIAQGASRTENYGGNTNAQGFTDMVDLGNLMQNTDSVLSPHAGAVVEALDDAVIYSVNGANCSRAHGLSVFYPLACNNEVFQRYEEITDVITGNLTYLKYLSVLNGNYNKVDWKKKGDKQKEKIEPIKEKDIKIKYTQTIDSDVRLRLTFKKGLDDVASIRFNLGFYDPDDSLYLPLGTDNDIEGDWDEGVFVDNFDGTWIGIDDNLVNAQISNETDDYTMYAIPINLNGKRSNLIAIWRYDENRFEVLGAYDGVDEASGTVAKGIKTLKEGDEVAFLFMATDIETGDGEPIELNTMTWHNDVVMDNIDLGEGDFIYRFEIVDVLGNTTYSDPVIMHVKNGVIEPEELK